MHIKNLSLSFGVQEIFTDVNLYIKENEKIGIIGINGAGKTTFFKLLLNKIDPNFGKIILEKKARVAWLPQVIDEDIPSTDITVLDFLLLGRPIEHLSNELKEAYIELANNNDLKIISKINRLEQELDYWDRYNAENILLKITEGMNMDPDLLDKKLSNLSGGQKSKVAFAKLLYSKPEIMLLDEPTNHLDKETKSYVINYLKNYQGSVFIISHDLEFLDLVTDKTLYLDKKTHNMTLYNGNYSNFKKLKAAQDKVLHRQAEIQQAEEDKLKAIVLKYQGSSGNRKRMAQDREKKLNRLLENKIEITANNKNVNLEIKMHQESNNIPIKVSNLYFKYDKNANKNIINNLSFELNKGEKFLVVGVNGVGKSTLLKLIVDELTPDSGSITINHKTQIAYYAQEHELLDNDKTIMENFSDIEINPKELRSVLGRFLFYGDDVFKKVKILSPGERSRVALAKLTLKGANLLVLDEPTNHLDPETQKIIADTFKTFKGTMLVVSHNTEFINNLGVERTLTLPDGKISYYDKDIVKYYERMNTKK